MRDHMASFVVRSDVARSGVTRGVVMEGLGFPRGARSHGSRSPSGDVERSDVARGGQSGACATCVNTQRRQVLSVGLNVCSGVGSVVCVSCGGGWSCHCNGLEPAMHNTQHSEM